MILSINHPIAKLTDLLPLVQQPISHPVVLEVLSEVVHRRENSHLLRALVNHLCEAQVFPLFLGTSAEECEYLQLGPGLISRNYLTIH